MTYDLPLPNPSYHVTGLRSYHILPDPTQRLGHKDEYTLCFAFFWRTYTLFRNPLFDFPLLESILFNSVSGLVLSVGNCEAVRRKVPIFLEKIALNIIFWNLSFRQSLTFCLVK